MATYTPNLNLGKPEATDPFGNFRQLFNDNMDILDNGGGGGSGGHTIVNENGTDMPAEGKLQFTGGVTVTDDSVNGKTVVDISGGGGNVYGAFIDTNRLLTTYSSSGGSAIPSYTATEDCAISMYIFSKGSQTCRVYIDSVEIQTIYFQQDSVETPLLYLKRGQTISFSSFDYWSFHYEVYGLTQGTNGIFTPIIYSDTERVVGVWRDNKPLYAKTYSGLSISCTTQGIWYSTGQNYGDIEKIIHCELIDQYGQNIRGSVGYMSLTPKPIAINCPLDNRVITAVTIWYTKTTDVAGSGNWNTDGVPTVHYSTTEQVIGTWENGKPLYARLINPNITANATASGDIKYGSFALSNFIADVDMAWIDTEMSYYEVSGATRGFMSAWYQKDNGLITITTLFERNNVPATIAIKYTKSTD